jgi:hypothetical protein
MKKQSKQKKVAESIVNLEVGETIGVYSFIVENWGNYDFFIRRSFDVYLSQAKKKFPDREFKVEKGLIKRIK